mmetsp:Transcript_17189/g.37918  ORF Transcript_17189/g.37918 Transcript_17189/m.37918 type:complete len:252 (+) Transcript_17189:584-1339(+)
MFLDAVILLRDQRPCGSLRWRRDLRLKHHQWISLTREHAATIVHPVVTQAVASMYFRVFGHQPLCSDEVVPLLSLRLAAASGFPSTGEVDPWNVAVPRSQWLSTTDSFAGWLATIGVRARCATYAHWTECSPSETVDPKDLARSGILFLRTANVNLGTEVQLRDQEHQRTVPVLWPNELSFLGSCWILILQYQDYKIILAPLNLIAAVLCLTWFSAGSPRSAVIGGFTAAGIGAVVACRDLVSNEAFRSDL